MQGFLHMPRYVWVIVIVIVKGGGQFNTYNKRFEKVLLFCRKVGGAEKRGEAEKWGRPCPLGPLRRTIFESEVSLFGGALHSRFISTKNLGQKLRYPLILY